MATVGLDGCASRGVCSECTGGVEEDAAISVATIVGEEESVLGIGTRFVYSL